HTRARRDWSSDVYSSDLALAWMAAVLTIDVEYASLVPAMAMAGIGMGMTFAPMTTAVLDGLPGDDHAVASGVNATMREVGIVAEIGRAPGRERAEDGERE